MQDLSNHTIEQLAELFEKDPIITNKRLLQGCILVEARSRFKFDWEFGRWVKINPAIAKLSVNYRGKLMQYARYFHGKDHTGISYSVAAIISEPRYREISNKLYKTALNSDLTIDEIRAEVRRLQGNEYSVSKAEISEEDYLRYRNEILPILDGLSEEAAHRVLKSCKQAISRNWK
jgi:hypothetical protein